jgi:hypothetical protein
MKEISGKNTSITDFTHCINKAVLCSGYNNHISEEVLNSLDG